MERKGVALVTGGSRGIGAAAAVALARRGYDVALLARTLHEGQAERRIKKGADVIPEGSLERVASQIESQGRRALALKADLTDRVSVGQAAVRFLAEFGRCDILCHIGVYQEPHGTKALLDTPLEDFDKHFEASVIAPIVLSRTLIPAMIGQGGGVIFNMTSYVVSHDPSAGDQWARLAYSAGKAGGDRIAGVLNAQFGARGIRAFNGDPGFVALPDFFEEARARYPNYPICPPEAAGEAVAWVVTEPDANRLLGKRIDLPSITRKYGLLEGWGGPGSDWPPSR